MGLWTTVPAGDGRDNNEGFPVIAGGEPVTESEGDFNLSIDGDEFLVGDAVTLTGEHNHTCNITFEVDYPNGSAMFYRVEETVNDTGVYRTEFGFTISEESPFGNYTVYATNDLDNSTLQVIFEVVPPSMPDLAIFPGDITVGDEPRIGEKVPITIRIQSLVNLPLDGHIVLDDSGDSYCAPAYSPSGDQVVFRSDWDIHIMDSDGTDRTPLTSSGTASSPIWSNDGTYIAYYDKAGGSNFHIWIMESDGTNKQQLTSGNGDNRCGWARGFSEDDTKIIYTSSENTTLRVVERKTSDWSSTEDYPIATGYTKGIFEGSDTSIIAVTPKADDMDLWRLTANGTWDDGHVAERLTDTEYFYGWFDWIEYGILSYFTNRSGNAGDVWMQNSYDGTTLQVTDEPDWSDADSNPAGSFSNDGAKFVCVQDIDDDGDTEIWALNATATANVTLYDGDPDSGGTLIGSEQVAVWGNLSSYLHFEWTPTASGNHSLFFVIEDVAPGDDNSSNDRTFVNVTVLEPLSNVTVSASIPSSVDAGDKVTANITVWNALSVDRNVSLILQLFEPDGTPIPPRFLANVTITADNSTCFELSVRIPDDAITGTGDWQVIVCTGRPKYGGKSLDYDGGTIIIT